uniref:Uncharacterized protein n=1 Tax=Oryza glumipatula TaxID=40148 RepID=A0A0E0B296_9ORYZ
MSPATAARRDVISGQRRKARSRGALGVVAVGYSYAKEDQTSTFTCPAGTNYRVDFCPPTSGVMAGDDDGVRGHGLPRLSCRICASAAMVMVLLPPPATASRGGDRRELLNFRGFGVSLPITAGHGEDRY